MTLSICINLRSFTIIPICKYFVRAATLTGLTQGEGELTKGKVKSAKTFISKIYKGDGVESIGQVRNLRVRSFEMIRIRISDLGSLGSW